jgi:hypothetical protein
MQLPKFQRFPSGQRTSWRRSEDAFPQHGKCLSRFPIAAPHCVVRQANGHIELNRFLNGPFVTFGDYSSPAMSIN